MTFISQANPFKTNKIKIWPQNESLNQLKRLIESDCPQLPLRGNPSMRYRELCRHAGQPCSLTIRKCHRFELTQISKPCVTNRLAIICSQRCNPESLNPSPPHSQPKSGQLRVNCAPKINRVSYLLKLGLPMSKSVFMSSVVVSCCTPVNQVRFIKRLNSAKSAFLSQVCLASFRPSCRTRLSINRAGRKTLVSFVGTRSSNLMKTRNTQTAKENKV